MSNITITIEHLPSALTSWNDCPRRGAAKMFRSLILDAGYEISNSMKQVSGAIGTGVHKGAAHMLYQKRDHRSPVPKKEIQEISIKAYRAETQGGVMFDKISANHNTAEKQVGELIEIYQSTILPQIIPVDIETELKSTPINTPELTLIVIGHADSMNGAEIDDLKTGRSAEGYYAQMGGYSCLSQDNGHPRPDRLVIHWLPREKPVPQIIMYDVALCEQMAKSVLKQIVGQLQGFLKSGDPNVFPQNPISKFCSQKYCSACGTKWCGIKGEKE